MKKIFPLIFLSLLLLQFSNCKPAGKGKLVITLETQQLKFDNASAPPIDAETEKKITGIIKHRLEGIGIDAEDIAFVNKGNHLELIISGISNYPPDLKENVRRVVSNSGSIELWETFTVGEMISPLMKALRGNDTDYNSTSDNAWRRFSAMMISNTDVQNNPGVCELGFVKVKDTMKINALMDTAYLSKKFLYNFRHVWSQPEIVEGQPFCNMILLKATQEGKARMENPEISKVEIGKSGEYDQLTVYLSGFDTQLWTRMTKENTGKNIAIVVDRIAYTWPMVQSEIPGGVFSITGPGQSIDYKRLKTILEAGHFPVPVRIAEEKVID
jgi:hypothetical protein